MYLYCIMYRCTRWAYLFCSGGNKECDSEKYIFSGNGVGVPTKDIPFTNSTPVVPRSLSGAGGVIAAAVTVPILVIIVTVIVAAAFFIYRGRRSKTDLSKVLVQNEVNDPSESSSSSAPPPLAAQSAEGSVTFSKLKARFAKGKGSSRANGDVGDGICNPVYDGVRDNGAVMVDNAIQIEPPAPARDSTF
jgi:hypothetical protein